MRHIEFNNKETEEFCLKRVREIKNAKEEKKEQRKEKQKKIIIKLKKEAIPKDWEVGAMPIFKRDDNQKCSNYRSITLLNTVA